MALRFDEFLRGDVIQLLHCMNTRRKLRNDSSNKRFLLTEQPAVITDGGSRGRDGETLSQIG